MKIPQSGLKIDNPAFPLLQALISYWGVTDNNGNAFGTTIRCSPLVNEPSYANHALKILSGPAAGQTRDISTHPAGTDTITVSDAFSNATGAPQPITAGTHFAILSSTPTVAEVAAVLAAIAALQADVGDASTSVLGSIWNILGNPVVDLATQIAAIIAYVDLIDDAVNGLAAIKAEVEGLAGAAMRGTDNAALAATALSTATWTAALATALGNYTAARAGYLDNINQAGLLQVTAARAALLDNLVATTVGKLQIKATTIDLNQAAATYDLFTVTTQDVVVEKLVLRMPNSALAAPFTYLTIQTDDTTPIVLIDATAGAVGNLTAEAQLAWTGAILLDAGTGAKIRLTIAVAFGGAATVADVIAECRAVVAGGYLT